MLDLQRIEREFNMGRDPFNNRKEHNVHGLVIEQLAEMPVLSHHYTVE